MTVRGRDGRASLQELPAQYLPAVRLDGGHRAALPTLREAPGRRHGAVEQRGEPLIVMEARWRHREALAALNAAEVSLAEARRRGPFSAFLDATQRVETAGRAYVAADGWLLAVLSGRVH